MKYKKPSGGRQELAMRIGNLLGTSMSDLGKQQERFSLFLARYILELNSRGYDVRGGEWFRPQEMEELDVAKGLSGTHHSKHTVRCATDLYIFKTGQQITDEKELAELGALWESYDLDCEWGGRWVTPHDTPHFQFAFPSKKGT